MLARSVPVDYSEKPKKQGKINKPLLALIIGSLGIVFGDIGTSPLYAFREAVARLESPSPESVIGICSLIMWGLFAIVTVKYVLFLLNMDNRGEGGILSLTALTRKFCDTKYSGLIVALGLTGAGLFYGEIAITPAISVLSAVEGIGVISPALRNAALPLTIFILSLLFLYQKRGTGKISFLFGPIMVVWFAVLAGAGLYWTINNPVILNAFNPYFAVKFIISEGILALVILGSVFLAFTGAEALYADLGHFGRKPIQYAWLWLVFPALIMNYLGQGAYIISRGFDDHLFFLMFPESLAPAVVLLAAVATIIASQAVITGAFSLTRQAVHMGFLPRMEIRHTSADKIGQIYMPRINRNIFVGVILLCLIFKSSSALAAAYGIAVTGTMIVTTVLSFLIIRNKWKKPLWTAALIVSPFVLIETVFLGSNLTKIFDGAYLPIMVASGLVIIMLIWVNGTDYLRKRAARRAITLSDFAEMIERDVPLRVQGTAVYLSGDPLYAPFPLLQNVKHNKIIHQHNIALTVVTAETPYVQDSLRITVEPISSSVTRMFVTFGYMEVPNIPAALITAKRRRLADIPFENITYFLGRRTIIPNERVGLPSWQDHIYVSLTRTASTATDYYHLPPDKVVVMGMQMFI